MIELRARGMCRPHDTGVDRIIYNPNTKQLRLDVELAQYELPSYDESMPELVEGTLVVDDDLFE